MEMCIRDSGGYAKDINDVFKGILRKDSPCYVPKVKVEVPYIIDRCV